MSDLIEHIENPVLEIRNLSVAYNQEKTAVTDVSAGIKRNKVTAIMGPSGCGKEYPFTSDQQDARPLSQYKNRRRYPAERGGYL